MNNGYCSNFASKCARGSRHSNSSLEHYLWVIRKVCVWSLARAAGGSLARRLPHRPAQGFGPSLASLGTFLRGFPRGGGRSWLCLRRAGLLKSGHVTKSALSCIWDSQHVSVCAQRVPGGAVWFAVRPEVELECCPDCQSREFGGHGKRDRNVRTVPIGLKAVWLREELGLGWEQPSREAMANFFCGWCEKAIASGIKQLISSGRRSRNPMIEAR